MPASMSSESIPAVDGQQYREASLQPGERIAIFAASSSRCTTLDDADCVVIKEFARFQDNIEDCLSDAIRSERRTITISSYQDLAKNISLPEFTSESYVDDLTSAQTLQLLNADGIKYAVIVELRNIKDAESARWESGVDAIGALRTSKIYSDLHSDIYDLSDGTKIGHLDASVKGTTEVGAVLLFPLPVVMPFGGRTVGLEAASCKAMGLAVARFVSGAGNAFVVPKPAR